MIYIWCLFISIFKDLGTKCFSISRIDNIDMVNDMLDKLKNKVIFVIALFYYITKYSIREDTHYNTCHYNT